MQKSYVRQVGIGILCESCITSIKNLLDFDRAFLDIDRTSKLLKSTDKHAGATLFVPCGHTGTLADSKKNYSVKFARFC